MWENSSTLVRYAAGVKHRSPGLAALAANPGLLSPAITYAESVTYPANHAMSFVTPSA